MALTNVPYKPGVIKDDPVYTREGYAADSQWIRWVRGRAQAMGGYTLAPSDGSTFSGISRGQHNWADTQGNIYSAIGTNSKLYVFVDGQLHNVTPKRANGIFPGTTPFATVSGSSTVTVSLPNHQALSGDCVYIYGDSTFNNVRLGGGAGSFSLDPFYTVAGSNIVVCQLTNHGLVTNDAIIVAGGTAVNGITVSGEYLTTVYDPSTFAIYHTTAASATGYGGGTPTYSIAKPNTVTVTNSGAFTVNARTVANATGSGGGGNVSWTFELNVGLVDGPGSPSGYGSGSYGTGAYGVSETAPDVVNPRTWALDNLGATLYATPLGGAIYTWAQNWSQRAAPMTTGPQRNAYSLVTNERFIMTAGTTQLGALTALTSNPVVTTSGSPFVRLTVPADGWKTGDEIQLQGLSAVGGVTVVDNYLVSKVNSSTNIEFAASTFATSTASGGGSAGFYRRNTYVPMRIRNSDGGLNGDVTQWTPTATNLAGGFVATIGSNMIALRHSRAGIYAWSDYAMYFLRYTGQQDNPYTIDMLGQGCGLLGPNAVVEQDGTAYWMTKARVPYLYNGGTPRPLPSPVKKYFDERLADSQEYKVFGVYDALYPAVTWYYPSNTQPTTNYENDSYLRCDLLEAASDPNAGWSNGMAAFTSAIDRGLVVLPMACTTSGQLLFLESGDLANGATLSRSVTFGPLDIADGDKVMNVRRWVINADQEGTINLTLEFQRWPNGPVTTKGPYTITDTTLRTDVRGQGRQMSATFQSNNYFRLGKSRLDTTAGGYR